jgi:hypothetical protein
MLGLKDYFEVDFPDTAMAKFELQARVQGENEQVATVYAQVHIDFVAHVKFCSFYIPVNNYNSFFELCKAALSYSRDLLALRGNGDSQFKVPNARVFHAGQRIRVQNNEYLSLMVSALEGENFSVADFAIAPPTYIYTDTKLSGKEKLAVLELGKRYNTILRLRGPEYAMKRRKNISPVAFISHDSRDKDGIARPLAEGLMKMGFPVWFDEYSLKPGDRLRESIEKGMKECKKCILILTKNFLSNGGWTSTEFNTIFTREILEEKPLVVPVWFGVNKQEVFDYSPSLLNVLGAHWKPEDSEKSIREVVHAFDIETEL